MTRLEFHSLLPAALGWLLVFSACSSSDPAPPTPADPTPVEYHDPEGELAGGYSRSFALIVGISRYQDGWPRLGGVADNLDKLEAQLYRHGFEVEKHLDPETGAGAVFEDFTKRHGDDPDHRLLVFFAGHGHTQGDETGYLVEAGTPDPQSDPLSFAASSLPLADVVSRAEGLPARHVLILFDSCLPGTAFKNPQETDEHTALSAELTPRTVRQFIALCSAGQPRPAPSAFVDALVEALNGEADVNHDTFVTGTELGVYVFQTFRKAAPTPQFGKLKTGLDRRGEFVFPLPPLSIPPQVRTGWAQYLQELESRFGELAKFRGPVPEAVKMWQDLLRDSEEKDYPFSARDEKLRASAKEHLERWQIAPPPVPTAPGSYEQSFALLVGVGEYRDWPKLVAADDQMGKLTELLAEHDFEVETVFDPDGDELRSAVEDFIDRYGGNERNRLLIFFAGHGYNRNDGRGYLVPADAADPDSDRRGFLGQILPVDQMTAMQANHVLFLFDSCLSEAGFEDQSAEPPSPFNAFSWQRVRQVVTACGAGETRPQTSGFVLALIRALGGEADADADDLLTGSELGAWLREMAGGENRTPQYLKLTEPRVQGGDFIFDLRAARKKTEWRQRLANMENEVDEMERRHQRPGLSAAVKAAQWRELLERYGEDNPYSPRDDELRRDATASLWAWEEEARKTPPPAPMPAPPTPAPPTPAPPTPAPPTPAPPTPDRPDEIVVLRTESQLLRKAIGLSDNIPILETPGGTENVGTMQPLRAYFVLEDSGDSYRISSRQEEGGITGFVAKHEVAEWNTREGLHFIDHVFRQERRASVEAWESEEDIRQFARSLNEDAHGPTLREELQTRIGRRGIVPYPLLDTKEIEGRSGQPVRIHHVLIPATVSVSAETDLTQEEARDVAGAVTICVVFDARRSMKPYAKNFIKTLDAMLGDLGSGTRTAVGFILFREPKGKVDRRFEIVHPMPVQEALKWLKRRKRDTFGGRRPEEEPVLDAVSLVRESFLWNGGTAVRGAVRVAIVVASGGAEPTTAGFAANVEPGLAAEDVGRNLSDARISVYALQAGSDGRGGLPEVLLTLANATGGEFYRSAVRPEGIWEDFADKLKSIVTASVRGGQEAAEAVSAQVSKRQGGGTVIALDAIDDETRRRLQAAASEFHVASGGLITTKAWLFERPDLYSEKILIEKDLLEWLIRFFGTITDDALTTESLRRSTANLLSALTGETIPEDADVQELIEKETGIHFTTNLLSFELEELANFSPEEVALLQERIRQATIALTDFSEIQAVRFNEDRRVWMPVSYLP